MLQGSNASPKSNSELVQVTPQPWVAKPGHMSSEGVALAMAIPFPVAGGVMITAALCFYARTTRERIGERKGGKSGPHQQLEFEKERERV
jgi:hypothetical protein